jgi:DNA-binding response OmpR family regulator
VSETDSVHVVIIDDDPDVHEIIRMILDDKRYRIESCSSGRSGLAAVRANPPDLIILDIMLSTPTEGFELAATLQADPVLQRVPVVMVSSLDRESWDQMAQTVPIPPAPPAGTLSKPFDADELQAAIEAALGRSG